MRSNMGLSNGPHNTIYGYKNVTFTTFASHSGTITSGMCNYCWNMGLLCLVSIVSQKRALLWRFQLKQLRIDQDIKNYVLSCSEHAYIQFGTKSKQFFQSLIECTDVFWYCFDTFDIHSNYTEFFLYFWSDHAQTSLLMTVQEAHKEYNTLIDQIWAKYELLDLGAFNADCTKVAHLMAHMSDLCKHLNLPVPKKFHRPHHFKHLFCGRFKGVKDTALFLRYLRITALLSTHII